MRLSEVQTLTKLLIGSDSDLTSTPAMYLSIYLFIFIYFIYLFIYFFFFFVNVQTCSECVGSPWHEGIV